jgi:adenylate cyclase
LKPGKKSFWPALGGGALTAAIGVVLIAFPHLNGGIARCSYDLPFVFRSRVPDELMMIYVDENVKATLGAPRDQPLNRRFYARLVQRLKDDGARLVLLDLIFDEPGIDAEADAALAAAMKRHGAVVLVGNYEQEVTGNISGEVVTPPTALLETNAAAWGLARLFPDADWTVRRLDPGTESCASAGWVGANLVSRDILDGRERLRGRWLNYPAAPERFHSVNLDQALDPQGLPAGYFRGKWVVLGARPAIAIAGSGRDSFGTPFTRFGAPFVSGAAIHAVSLWNLSRGDWLNCWPLPAQLAAVILCGFIAGAGLMRLRPWHAAWLAAAAALLLAAVFVALQVFGRRWWPWLVPVAVQIPAALMVSIVWQYALESRRRKKLREAFAGYLSPHLADQIAEEQFDLSLGGKIVEATVMFTDLEGFTATAEKLRPDEVSALLTGYFNRTTQSILEEEGTIIKYMGDAVMAVWGAPLADPNQAERAVRAAQGMVRAGRLEIGGHHLRTRIGICSGPVLAGNLGSRFRFDYAAVGDTTNVAARLEALNKVLGTEILIAETTRLKLGAAMATRPLGRFAVAGRREPVVVHEVLAADLPNSGGREWPALFAEALNCFAAGELDRADKLFRQAIESRGGADGPSAFYLQQIAAVRQRPLEPAWNGVVVLSAK